MNPFVFICGCPRSGTTLLGRIADAHPSLAVVHESRWIARTFERRKGLTGDGAVTPDLAHFLCHPRALAPLGISPAKMTELIHAHVGRSFAALVSSVFDDYAARQGKQLAGDKSPGYVRYLPLLHQLWPAARFVHIVRDPRDVYLSVLDWGKGATRFTTFDADPATTTAVWWRWYVELGREAGARLGPDRYLEVGYESLVAEPEREVKRMCRFLGLAYQPRMLEFHTGRERHDPTLDAKKAWRPVTAGLRDWRAQLDRDDAARIEVASAALLDQLGYPRRAGHPDRNDSANAEAVRRAFIAEALARQRPLPAAWRRDDVTLAAARAGSGA